jgi:hypothetical protein
VKENKSCPLDRKEAQGYIILIKITEEKELKKLNPFDLAYEQYQLLKAKLSSTGDPQEKNVLFKRLVNLLAVMEFLVSLNKAP